MIIFLPILVFKSIINIRSIKDGLYMDENGTFVENENMNIFVEYVFNFQGAPTMKIIAANGKTLTVKKESLFWRNVKGKGGTKWLYIPVEEKAGLISSDNGYCFKRFADEIKLEDCPASKEDWTDCFLFQVKIGIDPDNINKCKRTIEKAKDIDTDYECGKKPTKPTPPCSQSPYRSKRNNKRKKYRGYKDIDSDYYSDQSSYTESDSYYRDNYKKRGRNFLINTSSEDSTEKEKSKNKNQSLLSSEINELFVLKNLLSKFKNTLKTHENTSDDK